MVGQASIPVRVALTYLPTANAETGGSSVLHPGLAKVRGCSHTALHQPLWFDANESTGGSWSAFKPGLHCGTTTAPAHECSHPRTLTPANHASS